MQEHWNWYGAGLVLGSLAIQLVPVSDELKWVLGAILFAAALACFAWPHVRLRFPKLLRSEPTTLPLLEAATRAYEQTRGTVLAEAAERDGSSIITWYCWALWPRLSIYGARPPSRVAELVPWDYRNRYSFELTDGDVVLQSRFEEGMFVNLHVNANEFARVLADMKKIDATAKRLWG